MTKPRLNMPPGTHVAIRGTQVTVTFFTEQESDDFADWLQWLDSVKDGTELVVNSTKTEKQ